MRLPPFFAVAIVSALAFIPSATRAAEPGRTISVTRLGLIPLPRHVTAYAARWHIPMTVRITATDSAQRNVADFLQRFLKKRGIAAKIASTGPAQIMLSTTAADARLGREGYRLEVSGNGAALSANSGHGLFYALQTFEELFNPAQGTDNAIHQVTITDWPRYRWRGMLLDCSRHFFPVPVVEKFIRVAAHYKLNVFHWHLTDDQGWRIQIPQYPLLTKIGAWRAGTEVNGNPNDIDHQRYGGYYTDAQIRQIVAYAQRRYVEVVPEIDIPGHCTAALAAYPWLAAAKGPFQVRETWGISNVPLTPSRRTFHFLDTVFGDLVSLFPGQYIHLGGDEVSGKAMNVWEHDPVVRKLMQSKGWETPSQIYDHFVRKMVRFIAEKGRHGVVWNAQPARSLPAGAVVECWTRDSSGIARAYAEKGHDVIIANAVKLYFDFYQGDRKYEPHPTEGLTTLREMYGFDPSSELPQSLRNRLLGVEGCLWTEFVPTARHLFYQLLPREMALAEISWTPLKDQHYSDFVKRTTRQYLWLRANGYNFRVPPPSLHFVGTGGHATFIRNPYRNLIDYKTACHSGFVHIREPVPDAVIYYTLNGAIPNARSFRYVGPIHVRLIPGHPLQVRSVAIDTSERSSAPSRLVVQSTRR